MPLMVGATYVPLADIGRAASTHHNDSVSGIRGIAVALLILLILNVLLIHLGTVVSLVTLAVGIGLGLAGDRILPRVARAIRRMRGDPR